MANCSAKEALMMMPTPALWEVPGDHQACEPLGRLQAAAPPSVPWVSVSKAASCWARSLEAYLALSLCLVGSAAKNACEFHVATEIPPLKGITGNGRASTLGGGGGGVGRGMLGGQTVGGAGGVCPRARRKRRLAMIEVGRS